MLEDNNIENRKVHMSFGLCIGTEAGARFLSENTEMESFAE